MSLLDELNSLDLSAVVNARATISASSGVLSVSLEGGAALSALGDLGQAIQDIQGGLDDPADLLRPLVDLLVELAQPLREELPVGPWLEGVQTGLELLLEIIESLNGEPEGVLALLGGPAGNDLADRANRMVKDYTPVSLDKLTQFRQLVAEVEGGLPSDSVALADLAVRLLQPFEGRPLGELREGIDGLLASTTAIGLPRTRLAGLQASLQEVIQAAENGQVAALESALAELARVRTNTLNTLRGDLAQVGTRVNALPLDPVYGPMHEVGQALQTAEEGVLEFMEKWRREIVASRQFLETADFSQVGDLLNTGLDLIEDTANQLFVAPVDEAVEKLKAWLRGLLAHLRLEAFRGEITQALSAIARGIEEADLDGPAREARHLFDAVEEAISGDLVGSVQGVVTDLKGQIDGFLNDVGGALTQITNEINGIADQARDVLERVADELERFRQTIDQITQSIEQLGIEAATEQVLETVTSLRQTAEQVLNNVALPAALRPVIEQLIAEVEGVDLDPVFAPAYRVAEMDFSIPAEVTQGLDGAAEAITNLIPDQLIAEIEAEVSNLLDVVRGFDPTTLLGGVTDQITGAATQIRQLDPRPAVDGIRGPYLEALALLDEAHPNRLLAPAIDAWDRLLGEINLKSPEDAIRGLSASINTAGEQLAQQAVAPIRQMAPEGMLETTETGADEGQTESDPADVLPVRPGDVIRMFGYLPDRLRRFISQLEDSTAHAFLARLDSLGRGLAADLRGVPDAIMGIERHVLEAWDEMLAPIGQLQFAARLSIEANFDADRIDLNGALDGVASVRPAQLRRELRGPLEDSLGLVRQQADHLTQAAGGSLTYAVTRLEQNPLHGLTQDLDAFLAALDPEPIAAELDALVNTTLQRAPEAIDGLQDDIKTAFQRLEHIVRDLNPANQALKFLTVTEVLEEQVALLDPRKLAAELAEIHQAIRAVFEAYDPAILAQELFEVVDAVAGALEALDPATLLGDLADFDVILTQVEDAVPTQALAGIDASLETVGARLQALDLDELMEAINQLPERLIEAVRVAVESIKHEIQALLEAIKYASENASFSLAASVSIG